MTREERITALIAGTTGKADPYTEADRPALRTLSDARFCTLETLAEVPRGSTEEEILESLPEGMRTLVAKGKEATAEGASKEPMSEEEFLRVAPQSIRTLVAEKKAADEATRVALVRTLSTAQQEYTKDELEKMELKDLSRLARAVKVDQPPTIDFSGLGAPRSLAAGSTEDVFANPPDPYALAIAAGKKTVVQ